jgi:hypothetical protein
MAKKAIADGEYLERNPNGGYDIVPYTEEFILDDAVDSIEQARMIIKRGLITQRLSKQTNFKRVRTCQILSFEKTVEAPENSELDQLLTKAAQLECIPVNINNYRRPDYKIKALQDAIAKAEQRAKAPKKKQVDEDQGYVD